MQRGEEVMHIRSVEERDLPIIEVVVKEKNEVSYYLQGLFNKNIEELIEYIMHSKQDDLNHCFVVASDIDECMGTVFIKNIDDKAAELYISVRDEAKGRGYAWFGMTEVLRMAFYDMNFESVYWAVHTSDKRAIRFFNKHNFHEVKDVPTVRANDYYPEKELKWYCVLKGDELNVRESVAGCKVVHINTIPTVDAGELSFFEANHEFPFEIKRIYYISKVPEGVRRGYHAHKKLKQLLFCPYGRIQLVLENEWGREEIELSDPSIGIIIDKPTWREMLWMQKNSVLCVAASDYYEIDDYIRDHEEFRMYIEEGNHI